MGVKAVLAGWDLHQSKSHPRLPNTSQYKGLLYLPPFCRNSNVKLLIRPLPPNPTSVWGLRWTWGSKMVPIEISTPHSYSTSIHTLGTIHNAADFVCETGQIESRVNPTPSDPFRKQSRVKAHNVCCNNTCREQQGHHHNGDLAA